MLDKVIDFYKVKLIVSGFSKKKINQFFQKKKSINLKKNSIKDLIFTNKSRLINFWEKKRKWFCRKIIYLKKNHIERQSWFRFSQRWGRRREGADENLKMIKKFFTRQKSLSIL